MKVIKEILSVLLEYSMKSKSDVLSFLHTSADLKYLLRIMDREPDLSEEEIMQRMFESDMDKEAYRFFKKEVERKLINAVFFMDFNGAPYNAYQKAYYNSWKKLAAAKILLGKSATHSALQLLEAVLRSALKYEFTPLGLESARILRLHAVDSGKAISKFRKLNEQCRELAEIYQLECQLEELYSYFLNYRSLSRKDKEQFELRLSDFHNNWSGHLAQFDTFRVNYLGYLVRAKSYFLSRKYDKTIKVCNEAIGFFSQKKIKIEHPVLTFNNQKLICYIQLKDFENGEAVIQQQLPMLKEGSSNWFVTQQLRMLLVFHSSSLNCAEPLLEVVKNCKKFKYLSKEQKERWRINEAYVLYVKALQERSASGSIPKLRLRKFLNEVPIYSRDKEGLNIPILIIQFLWLILQRKYSKAIDRTDALSQYCSRYLREEPNQRSYCFIKMLVAIIKADFHPVAAQRKAELYIKRLRNIPFDLSYSAYEIELIPYEKLWQMALDSLRFSEN